MTRKDRSESVTPPQLETPTDLSPAETQAVADALNVLIADALALYVKTKGYHWHVAGPHFRDYHLLFEEQAESVLKGIDILAERVRRVGRSTIRGIQQVADLQTIPEERNPFTPALRMIQNLMEDNRRMAQMQRQAIEICESCRDTPTANRLQELLDETEKRVWFLYEASREDAMHEGERGWNEGKRNVA